MTTLQMMSEEELRHADTEEGAGFGSLDTERGPLPLEAMAVDAKIDGLVFELALKQTFVNVLGDPMEATYIFPLPDRAAVSRFRMEVAGRVVEGVIKERGEAREQYDRAIAAGHRAAITEEERPGVFTIRVGNIMPGEQAVVRLTLTGPLPFDAGEATFRFPLVVAPRYVPGAPLEGGSVGAGTAVDTDAVPDASRITPPVLLPGFPNPVRLSLTVELSDAGLGLSDVRSSLHAVDERAGAGRRRIELRPGERLDRDFILRWRLGQEAVQTSLLVRRDEGREEGTFMLTVVPPATLSRSTKPRDVVFVLDRSGSMGGWKMVAARRAVGRMVDTLTERDRFTVIAFDHAMESPDGFSVLEQASDRNRFRAVEFLAGIEARGGTEMARPLESAADLLAGGYEDRERVIVLATDGQVGNEDQILRMLGRKIKNVRVFCVGIDRAVNGGFLKRLATLGGGLSELVESEDRLDEVMDRVHRRIGTPVLTELALSPRGLDVDRDSVVPHRLPDLFAGAPVVITGRFKGPSEGAIGVAGKDARGGAFEATLWARASASDAVTRVWARGRVRDLEDRYVITRAAGLEKEIVRTSIRFSVLCRFTAFVAVDEAERVNPSGSLRQVVQPVNAPSGWDMFASAGAPGSGGRSKKRSMTLQGMAPPAPCRAAPSPMEMSLDALDLDDGPAELEEAAKAEPAPVLVPVDLAPYRRRVTALLERMRQADTPEEALRLCLEELRIIVADMRAAGAPDAELAVLAAIVGAWCTDAGELDRTTRALERFAGRPPARRTAFWR